MTIDLYLMRLSPPCRAVQMVAKQLNIDLNLKQLNLRNGEHLTPEFLKINPAHTVPTIVDDGFALWESRAIIQYLCNKYAPDSDLYPKDPKERAKVDRMLNFDMSSFAIIREAIIYKLFRGIEPTEEKVQAVKNNLKLLDTLIGDNKYVAGTHLTIADLSFLASSSIFTVTDYDLSDYPNVKEWLERLETELPYFDEINGKLKEEFKAMVENMRKNPPQK
jgi:glutathione S-transferase